MFVSYQPDRSRVQKTYVDDERSGDDETRQSQAVADLLHGDACRAEGRGGHVGATEVVDDDANGDVGDGHDALADEERAGVVPGVAHLGDNGEEGGRAGEGEDQSRQRRRALGEGRVADDLVVRDPDAALRSRGRAVLDSDSDGERQDCEFVSLPFVITERIAVMNRYPWSYLLEVRMATRPIQANQVILPSVWMLPKQKPATAATATKMAVQAP